MDNVLLVRDTATGITFRRSTIFANALLVVLIVVALFHFREEQQLAILIQHIQLRWIILVILLQACTYMCVGTLWKAVLNQFHKKTSVGELAVLSVERVFVDQVIPTLGIGGNFAVLNSLLKRNTERGEALAAVIIEVVTYYGAYFFLFLTATILLWLSHAFSPVIEYLSISFLSILVLIVVMLLWFVIRTKQYQLPKWIHQFRFIKELILAVEEAPREVLLLKRLWFIATSLQALVFFFDALTLWALFHSLGIDLQLIQALESFMLASAVSTVSCIPGGLGFFEGSALGVLYIFGIPLPEAATSILLFRGFTYWLPMVPGFFIFRSELQHESHTIDSTLMHTDNIRYSAK